MAIYIAIRPEWSITWLSMLHTELDIGDPDCLEALYDMTAEYVMLMYLNEPNSHPDMIPNIISDILQGYGVTNVPVYLFHDTPYRIFVEPWRELYTELKYVLKHVPPLFGIPTTYIDRNGALVGFVFDTSL